MTLPLAAYDLAWRLALGPLRATVHLDAGLRRVFGRGCLPSAWRSAERLLMGPDPAAKVVTGEEGPCVWLHAASLGESKGLWALAESLLHPGGTPGLRLVVTANTAPALAWLASRAAGDRVAVAVAPLDHPGLVARFLSLHRVAFVVLYEAELWPNFIRVASGRGIPVALASGRMTARAARRLARLPKSWASLLDRLQFILAQGDGDVERFRRLASAPVRRGGDFKAAGILRESAASPGQRKDPGRLAFVSLHLSELAWFLPEWDHLMRRFALTVFPRRPEEFAAFRRALIPRGFALHRDDPRARHVLVDELGKVGALLPRCGSAFVGGTVAPLGGHNLWEPLAAGCRIWFGPSTFNQETPARLLLEKGLAERISDPAQARSWIVPEAAPEEACRAMLAGELRFLEESEAALRAGIGTAVSRFYLFSGTSTGLSAMGKHRDR